MSSWRETLKNRRHRKKRAWSSTYESTGVVLIQDTEALIALRVATKLLEHIGLHDGTAVDPVACRALLQQVGDTLPDSLNHELDAEAEAILSWCFEPQELEVVDPKDPQQLAALRQHTHQRLSLFEQAIEQQQQVTFEYYSTKQETWLVITGQPLRVETSDDEITWIVVHVGSREWSVDTKYIRWLMPSESPLSVTHTPPKIAKVLTFPFNKE